MKIKPLRDWIMPKSMLAGIVSGFTLLCVLGKMVSEKPQFDNFVRFSHFTSFETQYYPTAKQVEATARANLDPKKIAVVIGGSSVLNGWGQRGTHVWSQKLQEILGDKYSVVNLAMAQTAPHEIGMVVAESLLKDYPEMIFIGDLPFATIVEMPVDGCQHSYFFWDAYFRGMIPAWETRDKAREALYAERQIHNTYTDIVLAQKINSLFNTSELWNWISYRYVSTVCEPTYLSAKKSLFIPRSAFPDDPNKAQSWSERMQFLRTDNLRNQMEAVLNCSQRLNITKEMLEPCFSPDMRPRTIIILTPMWKKSWQMLSATETKVLKDRQLLTQSVFNKLGITCNIYQDEFPEVVFIDTMHFDEDGGDIFAQLMAADIKKKAKELGYE